MPSAQMLDFGPNPLTESMAKFGSGFADAFNKQQTQIKNEEIFDRIKKNYGSDAKPDRIIKDLMEAEGLSPDFKHNVVSMAAQYASAEAQKNKSIYQNVMQDARKEELNLKKDKNEKLDQLNEKERQNLLIQNRRLDLEQQRIDQTAAKDSKELPELISRYTNSFLKDAEDKLPPADKSLLNKRIHSNLTDDKMNMADAFDEALEYVQMKNQIVDEATIEKRPEALLYGQPNEQELQQASKKAYEQLSQLYEAGVDSQKDLRAIAKKSGWRPEEITSLLQAVYSSNGRKLRVGKSESKETKNAQPPTLDDILFGD